MKGIQKEMEEIKLYYHDIHSQFQSKNFHGDMKNTSCNKYA
jgi:hypothetical protein